MENIVLKIKSTQEINGQSDTSEFVSCGTYDFDNNNVEVIYDESVALGVDNVKTKFTVKNGIVQILRNNGDFGSLVIEEGKRHLCQYYTQYGNIMIGIFGNKVETSLNDHGGYVNLIYSIDVNSGLLSHNKVEIEIREEI